MTDYENPLIPEGINVSPTHPLKEFALLLGGVSALIVTSVLVLALLAGYLVRYVPFAQEQRLISAVDFDWLKPAPSAAAARKEAYLQSLADRLVSQMDLPPGMSIHVHYSPDETINAMAFLGGNIVVFQGLIDTLSSENALAMVLAHEISHVRHRHPIIAMGRGFTVVLALTTMAGIGDDVVEHWLGSMGSLPVLAFSRAQEEAADSDALRALQRSYGHVGGALDFFEQMIAQSKPLEAPTLFNTHPGLDERIVRIRTFSAGKSVGEGRDLVPLPDSLK